MILDVKNLQKRYSHICLAVEDLSFSVEAGQKIGLLGLNGAGKSTTFKLITGLLYPDHGEIFVEGLSMLRKPSEAQKKIGYLPENAPLCPELTPDIHLGLLCKFYGLSERKKHIDRVVEQCELEVVRNRPIRTLSKGFRQRVALASALIHEPKILILDEPTSGLDPQQVDQFRQLILRISEDRAVVLSTHILAEVEAVCNRCLMIHKGRLVHDTPLPVEQKGHFEIEWKGKDWTKSGPTMIEKSRLEDQWQYSLIEMDDDIKAIEFHKQLHEQGVHIRRFGKKIKRLEDIFLEITCGTSKEQVS